MNTNEQALYNKLRVWGGMALAESDCIAAEGLVKLGYAVIDGQTLLTTERAAFEKGSK